MYLYIGFKVCSRFLSQTNIRNRALLITGYKNVLLFKESMTHLRWLCLLKRYLCYICRSAFQIILGRIQWQGSGCTTRVGAQRINHANYNPSNLNNDIALLRFNNAVTFTSEYVSPVYRMLFCVCSAATCDRCSILWPLHILEVDSTYLLHGAESFLRS